MNRYNLYSTFIKVCEYRSALDAIDVAEVEFRKASDLSEPNPKRQPTKLCPSCLDILTSLVKN